jgi:hypothetical protein
MRADSAATVQEPETYQKGPEANPMASDLLMRSVESAGRSGVGTTLLIVALCVGCGRSTTVVGPDGEKATVTRKGEAVDVTVKGKHGEETHVSAGGSVALPDGFPADVPIYPKATIVTTTTVEKAMQVMLKTTDSAQQAETFYKEKLKQGDWEIKSSMNTPQMTMLQGAKKGRILAIIISAESGQTMINLTVGDEK